jgi:predicted ATPase/Tfp pilus assembly protein PilF
VHATRFIGREADLFRLAELFHQSQRLITLWGPAGIGKSRMAAEHAEQRKRERTRIAWCDLKGARTTADVCTAMGTAMALPDPADPSDRGTTRWVARALANWGPLLVVLDNADRAKDAAAEAVTAWIAAAPDARFLVTSRERLGTPGEMTYELLPMVEAEAIELFADRARLLRSDFKVSSNNRAVVAHAVERLERIPLAIELAAARIDVLGLDGILERLGDALAVPALRSAIEWSWELLDPAERAALAQSSVFAGGFTLDAAEGILRLPDDTLCVLDALHALRDKSFLRTQRAGDSVRFSHYEAVRGFAAAALEDAGEVEATRARHAAFFVARAAELDLATLCAEVDNLRAVHCRALDAGDIDAALRAAIALDRVLTARGPIDEHLGLFEQTLVAAGDRTDELALALLRALGNARRLRGDLDGAERDLARVAATAEGALAADALADLGVIHHQRRAMDRASEFYERALDLARLSGARPTEARVLGNLAALDHDRGNFDDAETRYRRALALFADLGDRRHEGIFLTNLAILEQEVSRHDDARTHFRAALDTLDQLDDARLVGITLGNMAALEHKDGHLEESRACYERALELLQSVGELRSEALCRGRLAAVIATLGDLDLARTYIDVAERLLERVGDAVGFEAVQLSRAFVDLTEANRERGSGNDERATELMRAVERRLEKARSGSPSAIERSDDARSLVTILENAISELDGTTRADALLVGPEARWFRGPGRGWQDLSNRRALRLILLELTEMRRAKPGTGVGVDALREAGWPNEKMSADAASNRVYVSLNKLRKLGLEGVLVRNESGYMLDPSVPVERISTHWRALGS